MSSTSKLNQLRALLKSLDSALVCFSGGIDSTLVLAVAHEQLGPRALAMTALSPSVAPADREDAARLAQQLGARHLFVQSNELQRPEYVRNAPDRCYHCKTELYQIAVRVAHEHHLNTILNGTNHDDLGDYRPGLQAATDAAVRSPLLELSFTKADVRAVAKELNIEIWSKPASACLASRLPYGTSVTPERLHQVATLEAFLRAAGFRQLRVRYHDELARVEVAPEELPRLLQPDVRHALIAAGREAGFTYVTVDLAGYRQGSHNEVLAQSKRNLPILA